jgi:hypothetical protein
MDFLKHKLESGIKKQKRLEKLYRKKVRTHFDDWWTKAWNEPLAHVETGEISWAPVGEGATCICEQRAHWGDDVVERGVDPKYSKSQKSAMRDQLRVQHTYEYDIADGRRPIYGERLKYWESWWTSFMNRDIDRYNELLYDWKGNYKLGDSKYQGHPDHKIRQVLWER